MIGRGGWGGDNVHLQHGHRGGGEGRINCSRRGAVENKLGFGKGMGQERVRGGEKSGRGEEG
jgi:hypothetical protein